MAGELWHAEHEAAKVEGCDLCYLDSGSDSSTTNEGEEQEPTLALRFIRCPPHYGANRESARSQFCYIQDDGSHRKGEICVCGSFPKEECPIDLHRRQAVRGSTGESGLHA